MATPTPVLAELTAVSRDRQRILDLQVDTENRLRSIMEAYHPAPLHLFSSLDRDITLAFIRTYPTPAQARALLQHLASQLNIPSLPDLPAGVLAYQRGDVRLLLNFTDALQTVTVGTTSHTLPPRDLLFYR